MELFKKLFKKYKEQIMYLIFGVLTTAVNFVVYFILLALGLPLEISNALAIGISILFAYITNKIWVFESKVIGIKAIWKEFCTFISLRLVSAVIDMASMIVMVRFLLIGDFIAKTVTSVVVIVLNYIFSKLFVFKKTKNDRR